MITKMKTDHKKLGRLLMDAAKTRIRKPRLVFSDLLKEDKKKSA